MDGIWQAILGFISGVVVAWVSALIAHSLQVMREHRNRLRQQEFEIYMMLLELNGLYFWYTASEVHREPVKPELRAKARDISWRILDKLRQADEMEDGDELIHVLLSEDFESAVKRSDAMEALTKRIGERINPRYNAKIKELRAYPNNPELLGFLCAAAFGIGTAAWVGNPRHGL